MHVLLHACMHVCMYVCMCACMYACMHACIYVCMYVCMYACMYVCMHACMHACIYVCMYVCKDLGVVGVRCVVTAETRCDFFSFFALRGARDSKSLTSRSRSIGWSRLARDRGVPVSLIYITYTHTHTHTHTRPIIFIEALESEVCLC